MNHPEERTSTGTGLVGWGCFTPSPSTPLECGTRSYKDVMTTGRINYSGFGTPIHPGKVPTDPCKILFKGFASEFVRTDRELHDDNNNVNIQRVMDDFLVLTDTPLAISFDPNTLAISQNPFQWNDTSVPQSSCAHPQVDHSSGDAYNFNNADWVQLPTIASCTPFLGTFQAPFNQGAHPSLQNTFFIYINIFLYSSYSTMHQTIGSYMHSFAMTKNYIILTATPLHIWMCLVFSVKHQPVSSTLFFDINCNGSMGTLWIVFNRSDGSVVGTQRCDAFFTFHHVNAFEYMKVKNKDSLHQIQAS